MKTKEIENGQNLNSQEENNSDDPNSKTNNIEFYYLLKHHNLVPSSEKINNICDIIQFNILTTSQLDDIINHFRSYFKDSSIHCDIRSFLIYITREYHDQIQSIISKFVELEFDSENVRLFFSYVSNFSYRKQDDASQSGNTIPKTKISIYSDGEYFKAMNDLLLLSKYFNVFPHVLNKNNDLVDITTIIITLSNIYLKIITSTKVNDAIFKEYTQKCLLNSFPNIMLYLIDLLSYNDKTLILNLFEVNESRILFNNLSHFNTIRSFLLDFLLHSAIYFNKEQKKKLNTFIKHNNCLDSILAAIKNSYNTKSSECEDITPSILYEVSNMLIVSFLYKETNNNSEGIFQFLIIILKDYANINLNNPPSLISNYLNELLLLTFFNEDNLQSNPNIISQTNINPEIIRKAGIGECNGIQHYEIINFYLDVYNQIIEFQNIISFALLKQFSKNISDYKDLEIKTSFSPIIIGSLYKSSEDVISYYFQILISLNEEQLIIYSPINDIIIIIHSLHKCRVYPKFLSIFNKLKCYIKKNINNMAIMSEVVIAFFKELTIIIDLIYQYEIISSNDKKEQIFNEEIISKIAGFSKKIASWGKGNQEGDFNFNEKNLITIFDKLVMQYPAFAYKVWGLLIQIKDNKNVIESLLLIIYKRYDDIRNNLNNENSIIEFNYLIKSFKIFFKKDMRLDETQANKLYQILFSFQLAVSVKGKINYGSAGPASIQYPIIKYLGLLFKYISISNGNKINKIEGNYFEIKYSSIKQVLCSIIEITIAIDDNDNILLNIIRYIIDESIALFSPLKDRGLIHNCNNILIKENFSMYLIEKFNICTVNIKDRDSSTKYANKSNITMRSPMLIVLLLKILIKSDKYVVAYLNLIDLLCKLNDYNSKSLLRFSLVKILVKLAIKKDIYINPILNITKQLAVFFSRVDLETLFKYILINMNQIQSIQLSMFNYRIINQLSEALYDSIKYKRSIALSYTNISQPNIYNFLYTPGIKLHSNNNYISIYLSLEFHVKMDKDSPFSIIKLENEGVNNPICFELSIENSNLVILENKLRISFINDLTGLIRINKESRFLIELNTKKSKVSLSINNTHLFEYKLKTINFNNDDSYSLMIGYGSSGTKDEYDSKYMIYPYVTISYALIYLDQLTYELINIIKLCKIATSKMGSIKSENKKIPYLSLKSYQYISQDQSMINFSMSIPVDYNKISYELIIDSVSLMNITKLGSLSTSSLNGKKCTFLIDIIEKQYDIQISNRPYLEYIQCGNKMDYSGKGGLSHTFLFSKYNNMHNSFWLNWIYNKNGIKRQMKKTFVFIDTLFDIEAKKCHFFNWMIILLHESEGINNETNKKKLINSIVNLLSVYLVNNIPELDQLFEENCIDSLLIALYKNINYISNKTIDMLFYLAYFYDGNKKGLLSYLCNPRYHFVITELLLNRVLFDRMALVNKKHLLWLIKTNIISNDFSVDNYALNVSLLQRFVTILLMNHSQQIVDEEITHLIVNLVDKLLQVKKGIKYLGESEQTEVIDLLLNFIHVTDCFDSIIKSHIEVKFKDKPILINKFLKNYFRKLYSEMNLRNRLLIIDRLKHLNLSHKVYCSIFKFSPLDLLTPRHPPSSKFFSEILTAKINQGLLPPNRSISLTNLNKPINVNSSQKLMKSTNSIKFKIYKDDYNNTNTARQEKNQKGIWTALDNVNSLSQKNSVKYHAKKEIICLGNCALCSLIKQAIREELSFQKKYVTYKTLIKANYRNLFIMNKSKIDYLRQNIGLSFSWYLDFKEGPSRIRRKIVSRLDNIVNEEFDKTSYILKKKENKNNNNKESLGKCLEKNIIHSHLNSDGSTTDKAKKSFDSKMSFFDTIGLFNRIALLSQIFDLPFSNEFISDDDKYNSSFNVLMINGITNINSLLIFGKARAYIITNLIVDQNGILYLCKKPLKKIFWTLNNYSDLLSAQCQSLSSLDENNNKTLYSKESKFSSDYFKIDSFSFNDINEIHKRKFLHQNNSIEIFLTNGHNYFIVCNTDKRDLICNRLMNGILEKASITKETPINRIDAPYQNNNNKIWKNTEVIYLRKQLFIQRNLSKKKKKEKKTLVKDLFELKNIILPFVDYWCQGLISNFDYIMLLNTVSGRSYNDLASYPVFPWIIKENIKETIELSDESLYRDFLYPIYAQKESIRKNYKMKYDNSDNDLKYHSGSHYSTSTFVAYFLIRIRPFSQIAAEIQNGYFDTSDRIFFHMKKLCDIDEKYQEMIPELFVLPEAFVNLNGFTFNKTQFNETVDNVILPNWSLNNPRLFSKMIKKAMECSHVSEKISDWIDLIFGYKQKGTHAVTSYNIYRSVCSDFDPNSILSNNKTVRKNNSKEGLNILHDKIENHLIEISNMGQNPIQLFTTVFHPKKKRHQMITSFFSRKKFLTNMKPKTEEYDIKLNSNPTEIKVYLEQNNTYLTHGEGGLSSFRMFSNLHQDKKEGNDHVYQHIYLIVGTKKTLLPPKYLNLIDYSRDKYSFLIIKAFNKIAYEFATKRASPIAVIKASTYKNHIVIGYEDGSVSKYKIIKKHNQNDNPSRDNRNQSIERKLFKKRNKQINNETLSNFNSRKTEVLNTKIGINISNNVQSDIFSSKEVNFNKIQSSIAKLSMVEYNDFHIHTENKYRTSLSKIIKEKANRPIKQIDLLMIETNTILTSPISLIELCECYSLMVVIDKDNYINLFDLNSFELLRQIDYNHINYSGRSIRFISICPYTGDFLIATSHEISYFSINGVILANSDLNNTNGNYGRIYGKITCCFQKSVNKTETDGYVFTGHDDGFIIIWSIECMNPKDCINSYDFTYNRKYHYDTINNYGSQPKILKLQLKFEENTRITCGTSSISQMKISSNEKKLIVINSGNKLFYIKYEDNLKKKKKSQNSHSSHSYCIKCSSPNISSKNRCHICNIKICSICDTKRTVPEYSLHNHMFICEDCFLTVSSSNRVLYDY